MASETQGNIEARAIEWHVRLRDGDDATWEAFADWLAEDPRHADAYDLIEQADLAIEPLLPDLTFLEAANDSDEADLSDAPPVHRSRRWMLGGGALAASLAAALLIAPQLQSSRYDVATGPGEHRLVTLDATTQVALNGSTRMTFDHKDPRFASLASGEALFRVHHDSARPFTLELGDNRVEDVGTVFNVVRDASVVRVAVAEGKIVYNPKRDPVPLVAGQALVDQTGSGTVQVSRTSVDAVGAWQKGRLVYAGEPLSQVAADLGRALGVHITVVPAIADRPFSGAIALDGTGPAQLRRLMEAFGVTLEPGPDGWTMKPGDGARR